MSNERSYSSSSSSFGFPSLSSSSSSGSSPSLSSGLTFTPDFPSWTPEERNGNRRFSKNTPTEMDQSRSIKFLRQMVESSKYLEYKGLIEPGLIDLSPLEANGRGSDMNLLKRIIKDVHYNIIIELENSGLIDYSKTIYEEMFLDYCTRNVLLGIKALGPYMSSKTIRKGLEILQKRRGYNELSTNYLKQLAQIHTIPSL